MKPKRPDILGPSWKVQHLCLEPPRLSRVLGPRGFFDYDELDKVPRGLKPDGAVGRGVRCPGLWTQRATSNPYQDPTGYLVRPETWSNNPQLTLARRVLIYQTHFNIPDRRP